MFAQRNGVCQHGEFSIAQASNNTCFTLNRHSNSTRFNYYSFFFTLFLYFHFFFFFHLDSHRILSIPFLSSSLSSLPIYLSFYIYKPHSLNVIQRQRKLIVFVRISFPPQNVYMNDAAYCSNFLLLLFCSWLRIKIQFIFIYVNCAQIFDD